MLQGLTLSSLAYHYSKTKLETKNILHHGVTFGVIVFHFSETKNLFFIFLRLRCRLGKILFVPSKSIQKPPDNKNLPTVRQARFVH
jgi:hypothetical protein